MSELDDLLPQDFNAKAVAEASGNSDGDFGPLPEGWYTVSIERAELKDTQKGGKRLSVAYIVDGPNYQNRWVWDSFNLKNASPKAEEIAVENFAKLCTAVGIDGRPKSFKEIEGKRLDVKLKVKNDAYGAGNNVVAYEAAGSKVAASFTGRNPNVNNQSFKDDDIPF